MQLSSALEANLLGELLSSLMRDRVWPPGVAAVRAVLDQDQVPPGRSIDRAIARTGPLSRTECSEFAITIPSSSDSGSAREIRG